MANPALFAVIGDSLPKEKRALGFTIQAILKRVPLAVAGSLGGLAITAYGVQSGVRISLLVTIAFALLTVIVTMQIRLPSLAPIPSNAHTGIWSLLPSQLKRLLASDILIRICEGLVDVLIVLYATNIVGITAAQFGVLLAIQAITSMIVYLPAAKIADRIGRKPFVIATFLFFAAFPITVMLSGSFPSLVLAFVIGGLREIGEPARKAMIVDFALPEFRGRMAGFYYLVRTLSITPSAFIGGLLWQITPAVPFLVAGVIGVIGTVVFAVTVQEQYAS
jgi:MFS family permease